MTSLSPAFDDESIRLYEADCRRMEEVLEKASVSLAITSPPYPGVPQPTDDYVTFPDPKDFYAAHDILEEVWRGCFNVLEDGGRLVVNLYDIPTGETGMFPNVAETINRCRGIGFVLRETYIWHKGASYSPPHGSWPYPKGVLSANTYEPLLVFQKPIEFSQRRQDPSDYPEKIREASKLGSEEHAWLMDTVWKIGAERDREHPFPFPSDIPSRFIKLYSYAGDLILDPFSGGGTTILAARALGRRGVGFELAPKYVELTRKRASQGALF